MSWFDALARFTVFTFLMASGVLWMLQVAAPVLIGLPATWANAPQLIVAVPAFICFIGGWLVAHCDFH